MVQLSDLDFYINGCDLIVMYWEKYLLSMSYYVVYFLFSNDDNFLFNKYIKLLILSSLKQKFW